MVKSKEYTYSIHAKDDEVKNFFTQKIAGSTFYNACINYLNTNKSKLLLLNKKRIYIYRSETEKPETLCILIENKILTYSVLDEPAVIEGFKLLTDIAIEGKPKRKIENSIDKQENPTHKTYKIKVTISK